MNEKKFCFFFQGEGEEVGWCFLLLNKMILQQIKNFLFI